MLHWLLMAALAWLVASVSHAGSIVLANGDELNVEIIERGVDYIVIEHPQLGQVRLSLDQVEIQVADVPNPGVFGTRLLQGWSRRFDVGLNGRQGNSENLTITAGLRMAFEDEVKRWAFRGRAHYARDEDGLSDNDGLFTLRRDFLFSESHWFAFGSSRYAYDQFESWRHRIVGSAGPGYRFVQREDHKLDVRVGASFTREFGLRDREQVDGIFAIDYSWKPTDRYTFTLTNDLFTEVWPDPGEFRTHTVADWNMKIMEEPALSLEVGVENEYETDVEDGDERNDVRYRLSIGIDF
jgi:putative salt-induced outer membrane protein YdiY